MKFHDQVLTDQDYWMDINEAKLTESEKTTLVQLCMDRHIFDQRRHLECLFCQRKYQG